jgi:uncharacterized membrane protein YqgA involved in biofilm formation
MISLVFSMGSKENVGCLASGASSTITTLVATSSLEGMVATVSSQHSRSHS